VSRRWTRRRFLGTAGAASLGVASARAIAPKSNRTTAPAALSESQRGTLSAAMDEIVPAGDGMPGAVEAGVARYLEDLSARDADVRGDLMRAAAALARAARPTRFPALPPEKRVALLAALESREPAVFGAFRDLVYEGYYVNAEVWRRLGFEFYGPERAGPGVAVFDETALAGVKARGTLYRRLS